MMAREINNLLQSEYVDTGIVDFNFHCSVFDEADNSVVIGEAWRVDIPNMADPTVKTNKSAVCIKGAKQVSKALYNNPRWTLMPNFDLCQYYPTVIFDTNSLAAQCGKYMEISLKKLCRCGSGKAIVARRGAGFVFKSYMKQYRGRQWDIFAFCDGFGC